MSNRQNPQHVVTGKVRLSYVHLFKPYASRPGNEPKYSVTLLIPKSDTATRQRIDTAIKAATQQGLAKVFNGTLPPVLAIPIYDGDGVRPSDGLPFGEECKGHWVMTASSRQAPEIVDINLNPIIDQTQVYSGMYARVSLQFFPYNNTKKGIGCGLGNVQKLADGEPLGTRTTAAADFGDPVPEVQPQQPQQVIYQQPQQQQLQIDPITGKPVLGHVMGL